MDSLAFNGRSEGQIYVSGSKTEKSHAQTGAPDKTSGNPAPRVQFSSAATPHLNAIENRNCKTSDSAGNSVFHALGARALSQLIFAEIEKFEPINYGKVLRGIKILKEVVGNNSEGIKSVLTWRTGGSSEYADNSEFHRMGMLAAFLEFDEVKGPMESSAELKEFYKTLCATVNAHKTSLQKRL